MKKKYFIGLISNKKGAFMSILEIFISFLFLQALFKSSTFMSSISIALMAVVFIKECTPLTFSHSIFLTNTFVISNKF